MKLNGNKWKQMETKFRRRAARTWCLRRPRHIGSSCDARELPAPCHARLLAHSGAAAFGRSGHWQRGRRPRWRTGAFGARWHFDCYAIVSSRAVQSRASARSQALDATCVSRKRHQVHGDASFCAEREIPINIVGISDKVTVQSRRENAQEARRASTRQDTLIE